MKLLPITKLMIERSLMVDVLLLRAEWSSVEHEAEMFARFAVKNYELVQEMRADITNNFVNKF